MNYLEDSVTRAPREYIPMYATLPEITMAFGRSDEEMWKLGYAVRAVIDGKEYYIFSRSSFDNICKNQPLHKKHIESFNLNPKLL